MVLSASSSLHAEVSYFPFAGLTSAGKRPLPWVETHFVVLSLRGAYLATKSCVDLVNNSGINLKECAGHSGLKSQSASISWDMRLGECRPKLWTAVGSK